MDKLNERLQSSNTKNNITYVSSGDHFYNFDWEAPESNNEEIFYSAGEEIPVPNNWLNDE